MLRLLRLLLLVLTQLAVVRLCRSCSAVPLLLAAAAACCYDVLVLTTAWVCGRLLAHAYRAHPQLPPTAVTQTANYPFHAPPHLPTHSRDSTSGLTELDGPGMSLTEQVRRAAVVQHRAAPRLMQGRRRVARGAAQPHARSPRVCHTRPAVRSRACIAPARPTRSKQPSLLHIHLWRSHTTLSPSPCSGAGSTACTWTAWAAPTACRRLWPPGRCGVAAAAPPPPPPLPLLLLPSAAAGGAAQ